MRVLGIGDSSDYDTFSSNTSWQKAKDNLVEFAIYRATTTGAWVNGAPSMRQDGSFMWSSSELDRLSIRRFPYCWFDPRLAGDIQAKFFLDVVSKAGGIPGGEAVLDIEPASGISYTVNAIRQLKVWANIVGEKYDVAIYSYPSFIDTMTGMVGEEISWMARCEWFNAHWDVPAPRDPWPWHPQGNFIWQTTANMLGSRYGFYPLPGKTTPKICMAVM
jgi:hypothetical protein